MAPVGTATFRPVLGMPVNGPSPTRRSALLVTTAAYADTQLAWLRPPVSGTADLTGFPRRPHIKVRFFDPAGGQPRPDEDPGDLSARLLAEIRAITPPVISYRKR